MKKSLLVISALILFFMFISCEDEAVRPSGIQVSISIDPASIDGELDELYIGYAFDTAQFTGGKWWTDGSMERVVVSTPDLESEKLRNLVSSISPSMMRIGGTDCDAAYYCPDDGECELPALFADTFIDDENRIEGSFTHEDIQRAANFAEAVGSKIMFCVNVGAGPRDEGTGLWNSDNAEQLIEYINTLPNSDVFSIWEAGNEVNSINFHFKVPKPITPELFAQDLGTFSDMVDTLRSGDQVAAPSSYFYPTVEVGNFTTYLMPLANQYVDILTWHLYATQSERTTELGRVNPANKENLFDEDIIATHRGFAQDMVDAAEGIPVLNGECASAQSGGQDGVSDTMLDALWYADWIGIMAQEGTRGVIRHALVGSDYGLLDESTLDPRPTFLALAMFSRTVKNYRLYTELDRSQIKAHGFCGSDENGSITAVLSNPTDETLSVEIILTNNTAADGQYWTLDSDGDITAIRANIQGESAMDDGTIPFPSGTRITIINGKAYCQVKPNAVVFAAITPSNTSNECNIQQ